MFKSTITWNNDFVYEQKHYFHKNSLLNTIKLKFNTDLKYHPYKIYIYMEFIADCGYWRCMVVINVVIISAWYVRHAIYATIALEI